jgi:hypothetical protein
MKGTQFMRNDIETREIADAELDNVSGGVAGVSVQGAVGPVAGGAQVGVADVALPVGLDTVTSALPQVSGVAGTVTGLAGL